MINPNYPVSEPISPEPSGFAQKIQGLLGDPRLMDFGLGLLAQSGPVVGAPAPSLGQAIGAAGQYAGQRDQQRLRNDAMRQQMTERQNRNNAINEMQGLLSDPEARQDPQFRQKLTGLLMQIDPAQGISQMLSGSERPRLSTDVNDFVYMNPDLVPGTAEFREKFSEWSKENSEMSTLDQLRVQEMMLNVQQMLDERNEDIEEKSFNERKQIVSTQGTIASLIELAERNDQLADTYLATGRVGQGGRRTVGEIVDEVSSYFGEDSPERSEILTASDRFDQLSQIIVNEMAADSEDSGFGVLSNAKLAAIAGEKPSRSARPEANNIRIATMLDEMITAADLKEIPISPEYRARAEQIISEAFPARASEGSMNIESMSLDQLRNLDPSSLTPEQKEKAADRWDELNGG
jgi:hypothetical protein